VFRFSSFDEANAWMTRMMIVTHERRRPPTCVSIPVASPRTLIRLKDTPRPQDAIDRAFLEGVLRARADNRNT
jgi:hypothetical protein